jgi:DNA-binding response OmpR family regulator
VVCQSIRKDEELADTRVLIISGMVDPSEVESLREAGANDFIKKPFEIEDVVDRMLNLTAV